MPNCPYCGAEMGWGVVMCPNCGSQVEGEVSDVTHTDEMDPASDTIGDSAVHHDGEGGSGGAQQLDAPDTTTAPGEFATPRGEEWVADDVQPREPALEADATVPGSEVPVSHGGGWQQQDEDGEAPPELTHGMELDRPAADLPQMPDPDLGLDNSGGTFQRRPVPWTDILVVGLLVVIIALGAWYIWGGDGGDDDDGDGNGGDPYEGVHILRDGTWGFYPYEPPGEYHVTVVLMNNGSTPVNLDEYEVSIKVLVDSEKKGDEVQPLNGTIGAGGTRTFGVVVDTEVLGGGDDLMVEVTLRKADGGKKVHTLKLTDTV